MNYLHDNLTLLYRTTQHLRWDVLPTLALLVSLALGMALVASLVQRSERDVQSHPAAELAFKVSRLQSPPERP